MDPTIDSNTPALQNALMEARLARLEAHVEHLVADVADLRVGLARLDSRMDQGFVRQDAKMEQGFARHDAKMEQGFARQDAKLDRQFTMLGGMIVSLGVGFAGLVAKGFHWL